MRIEKYAEPSAPPEVVWRFLTEDELLKSWNCDILEIKNLGPSEPVKGARSLMKMKEGSRVAEYESEILEIDPYEKLTVSLTGESLGRNPMIVTYTLQKAGKSSRLNYEVNWKPQGFWMRMFTPIISIMANRNADSAIQRLTELVKQRA